MNVQFSEESSLSSDARKGNRIYCDEAAVAQTLEDQDPRPQTPGCPIPAANIPFLVFDRLLTIRIILRISVSVSYICSRGSCSLQHSYPSTRSQVEIAREVHMYMYIHVRILHIRRATQKMWPKSSKLLQLLEGRVTLSTSIYPLYPVFIY